ncbi:MAG: hypothetical protein NVSMB33_09430 [Ktedonobacteraceae bacterium]
MQFLPILFSILLGVLALAFVLYPLYPFRDRFFAKSRQKAESLEDSRGVAGDVGRGMGTFDYRGRPLAGELTTDIPAIQAEREQSARTALQEIELDYQLGNISEPDYRTLRERYIRRALVALKSRYDHEQELDDTIEAQLRKMREQHGNAE